MPRNKPFTPSHPIEDPAEDNLYLETDPAAVAGLIGDVLDRESVELTLEEDQ